MSVGTKVCHAIYWLAMMIWVGVLIAAAVAAAASFTVLPRLGLVIERFAAVPASDHGRLAAGHLMEPIFTFVDLVQFVAAGIVVVTVAVQWRIVRGAVRRPANAVRVLAIAGAAGLLVGRAVLLTPRLNEDLRSYWAAAEAGEIELAERHRATFEAAHPVASNLFSGTLVLLVIAVVVSPAALAPAAPDPSHRLETPALIRRTTG